MGYKNKEVQKAYQTNWHKKRRMAWINENGPCARCGGSQDLEIDHVDPRLKTMESSLIWSRSLENRLRELKLCQILCYSCHQAKTRLDQIIGKAHALGGRALSDPIFDVVDKWVKSLK